MGDQLVSRSPGIGDWLLLPGGTGQALFPWSVKGLRATSWPELLRTTK